MRAHVLCGIWIALGATVTTGVAWSAGGGAAPAHDLRVRPDAGGVARGPLRVHPTNPRYFTDGSGRVVYLTGAHTWNNLVDMGRGDPPERFDFDAYLDFLERHGHNFIRLWTWDSTVLDSRANGRLAKDFVHNAAPLPWARTGPGNALDGKPRFDLATFDPTYFERLRARVGAAERRGIYVSVMLFEGWGLMHGNRNRKPAPDGWAWRAHPFHASNNVNGIDGDVNGDGITGEVHTSANKAVNALQKSYLLKVVDAVNDFNNVLYEVINEGGEREWDWWVVTTVREAERTRPKQHPIGITGHGAERLESMLASPADWISPGRRDGYGEDPPAWDGQKVSLLDTDHIWGVGGNAAWVWKSFLRGHNPLFMDPYDGSVLGTSADSRWEPLRRAMGHTRRFAERMNLAAMRPEDRLASSGYCLAHAAADDAEYLVYLAQGGDVTVDLSASPGRLSFEWFRPKQGETVSGGKVEGGGVRNFTAPFDGDAVLYLSGPHSKKERTNQGAAADDVKRPSSPVIAAMIWAPTNEIIRAARDGDNWPVTWADDGDIYTTWGDGTGFEPKVEKKLSLGFARVTGGPDDFIGNNVRSDAEQLGQGRAGKKGWGILCVGGVLYLWLGHADNNGAMAQLAWSRDHAKTWTFADWRFAEFGLMGFINFGRDYAGARDEFVYAYSHDDPRADTPADHFVLLRAPKGRITQRESWEFFARVDGGDRPVWTKDIGQRGAVFSNPGRCLRSAMTYCAPLRRYLWWQQIPQPAGSADRGDTRFAGGFAIYDAPEPWGPWTTAFLIGAWDVGPGEHGDFPAKWMSEDGKSMHLVFSGEDSFSVRRANLQLHPGRGDKGSAAVSRPP